MRKIRKEIPRNLLRINIALAGRDYIAYLTDLLAWHPKTCVQNKSSKCYRKLRFSFFFSPVDFSFMAQCRFVRVLIDCVYSLRQR